MNEKTHKTLKTKKKKKNGVSLSRWNQGFDSPWDYQAETLGISTIPRVFCSL